MGTERTSRTTFGVSQTGIEQLGGMLVELSEGSIPDSWVDGVDLGDAVRLPVENIKTFYQEAATVQPGSLSSERLSEIKAAGVDNIKFAWMGSATVGEEHYYRIQGPTFLIEYDNVQNDANHAHSVWRDFDGDFGRDLLATHYQQYPHRLADD